MASLGQPMTFLIDRGSLSGEPQAGAACAPIIGDAGAHRVGAVTTDEPPVLVGNHRPEVDARHAMGTADDQDRVRHCWH